VVKWTLYFTKEAQKDAKKLASSNLRPKAEMLLEVLRANPFQIPPPFEKLVGDLAGAYSRRINIQHRLVYQVYPGKGRSRSCACGLIMTRGSSADSSLNAALANAPSRSPGSLPQVKIRGQTPRPLIESFPL